jgi:AAA domain
MTYTFRKAVRSKTPLLIGLVSPSGGGKTKSALRLATGIQSVCGGKIAGIDTEARRMLHYADQFDFEHMDMKAPFGSLDYKAAIEAAVKHGAKTIIVDSMSHEHEGTGGYLELHETELDRMAGDNFEKRDKSNFRAWVKPAGNRRKLINFMLQCDANFIFCFRAKEKLKIERGKDPKELGWQAIAGEEFVFEMLIRCLFLPGAKGKPDWSPEAMALGVPKIADGVEEIFKRPAQLDEDIGARLAKWAAGAEPKGERKEDGPKAGGFEEEEDAAAYITPDEALALEAMCTENGVPVAAFKERAAVDRFSQVRADRLEGAKKWILKEAAKRKEAATA